MRQGMLLSRSRATEAGAGLVSALPALPAPWPGEPPFADVTGWELPPDPLAGVVSAVLPVDPLADEPPGWVPKEPSWRVTDLLPDPAQAPLLNREQDRAGAAERESCAERPPPGLSDGTDPGPLLAALVAEVDLSSCSDDVVVGVAAAAARLAAWSASVEARATAVLVERAGRWRGVTPCGQPVAGHTVPAERVAAAELSCALGVSERSAQNRVALALDLRRLPETAAALAAGRQSLPTVRMVVDTLRPLGDEAAARVEAAVLPRYAGRCYSDVSRALRRAVLAVDPSA